MKQAFKAITGVLRRAVENEPALLVALLVAVANTAFSLTVQQQELGQAVAESLVYASFPAAVRPMVYSPATVNDIKSKKPSKGGLK